ncbi:MAG: DUF4139 domain-containing protein [Chloroflexota bacterium]
MPNDKHVSLTIYNQGTSLVRDRRTVELQAGTNTLDFTDVTAQIDATSVTLTTPDDPNGTLVLEQNYLYDLVGADALLKRYLDQIIEVTAADGEYFSGRLLSANSIHEIILQTEDGRVAYLTGDKIRDVRFPALPGGLMTRPTLRWLLHTEKAGARPIELTYLTGGMNWTADYNLLLATDNKTFDLNGWVTLDNTSGATFVDAQVKLVAGDVRRLPGPGRRLHEVRMAKANYAAEPEQVEQRAMFEYQLYEINHPVTVANNETKQVEFVAGQHVPANIYYVYAQYMYFGGYADHPVIESSSDSEDAIHITTRLEFSTGEEKGLGKDLPTGRIRVYQTDTDGAAVLIGENTLKHTPKGETVDIELGKAFDLVAERQQKDFRQLRKNVLEEDYEIRLRNRKDTLTVQIRVRERLFRWSNWEIRASSLPFTKLNSSSIEFRVDVPPGGETVLTYTVRYSWIG